MTAIIGHDNDIGVENLSAAAWIAGETSQAYNEIVTISMATSRAIGIGAYLVRLGQRVVQVGSGFDWLGLAQWLRLWAAPTPWGPWGFLVALQSLIA